MEEHLDTPGMRLRSAIDHAGLSVPELAERRPEHVRGASQNSIYRYIRGDQPSDGFLRWAADELNVRFGWLRDGTPPRYSAPPGAGARPGERPSKDEAAALRWLATVGPLQDAGIDPASPAGLFFRGFIEQLGRRCAPEHLPAPAAVQQVARAVLQLTEDSVAFFERFGGGLEDSRARELYISAAVSAMAHLLPPEPSGIALADALDSD